MAETVGSAKSKIFGYQAVVWDSHPLVVRMVPALGLGLSIMLSPKPLLVSLVSVITFGMAEAQLALWETREKLPAQNGVIIS